MNTITRILKLFLTTQTVNPPRFPLHVPNESIADKHPINIQIFCRKLRFRCQRILCIILFRRSRSGQVHNFMAALTCLRSVETNLTLTCPSLKLFVCNLPDSGRHATGVFHGFSPSRSVGRVGENHCGNNRFKAAEYFPKQRISLFLTFCNNAAKFFRLFFNRIGCEFNAMIMFTFIPSSAFHIFQFMLTRSP